MITERQVLTPSGLAIFHTKARPPESRWLPAKHILELEAAIQDCIATPGGRLIVSAPPRHSKTTSLEYAMADFLGKNPDRHVIYVSHGGNFAEKIGGETRDILAEAGPQVYGINLQQDSSAKAEWRIDGHQGGLKSIGWGGGILGHGADLAVADDLIKDPEEALNPERVEKLFTWWNSVLMGRLEPGASVILCSARWPGDLISKLTEKENHGWRILNFPALLGDRTPLWPERWSKEELEKQKATIGSFWWASQWMGQPQPPGGTMFNEEWINCVDEAPDDLIETRAWDLASTEGGGDYSAGCKMGYSPEYDLFFIRHVARGQWSPGTVMAKIKAMAQVDGYECRIRIEREPGASSKIALEQIERELGRYIVEGIRASGKKQLRWHGFCAAMEAQRVWIVNDGRSRWVEPFVKEILTVPAAKNDDQVDSASLAYNTLAQEVA